MQTLEPLVLTHPLPVRRLLPEPESSFTGFFAAFVWFGSVAGCLELAALRLGKMLDPSVPVEILRTNRHAAWMVPAADLLIFSGVGLALVILARIRPQAARAVALRLAPGLTALALLMTVRGLHLIAQVVLACGLGTTIGRTLEQRSASLQRWVRLTLPLLLLGQMAWTGWIYTTLASAERRAWASLPAAQPGQPNVLLIVLDTVRAASLGLYGSPRPTSPQLERLAQRGILFTEARSTAPWTLPSHASMFTGRWPHELSVGPDRPLDAAFPTLAEILSTCGYSTAGFVGNTRYCNALYGLDRGFARYEDSYENQTVSFFETLGSSSLGRRLLRAAGWPIHIDEEGQAIRKSAAMLNRDVLGWLEGRPEGRPFFVFLNYYDAHSPYVPPDDQSPRFGMATLPLARQMEIDARFRDHLAGKPSPDGRSPDWIRSDGLELYRDAYESCIAYLDHQLGRLIDEMERRGVLENTLIVVTADHGEHLGEHDILGHGNSLYRPEVHVPLLVIPPSRLPQAYRVSEPVSLREIPATVAAVVGLAESSPFPGRSLTRFLDPSTANPSETSPVLTEVEHMTILPRAPHLPSSLGPVRSIVSRQATYVRNADGREELYDLAQDLAELQNLAGHPDALAVLEEFRENLSTFCSDSTRPAP